MPTLFKQMGQKNKYSDDRLIHDLCQEGVDKDAAVGLIASKLEPLVGQIPRLRHMEVRRCYAGVDYALYYEFESKEALTNYATHPAHLAAKEHFWNFLNTRVCADYEV